jgi:hypothetical protein
LGRRRRRRLRRNERPDADGLAESAERGYHGGDDDVEGEGEGPTLLAVDE